MLLLDNGLNLTLQLVTNIYNMFGTCPIFVAPYHPAIYGAEERANGTLVLILRKIKSLEPLHCPQYLYAALLDHQISYYQVIELSTFKALNDREPFVSFLRYALSQLAWSWAC